MDARIEQVVTTGTCTVDDTEYEVENNTWIIGDDDEVVVIDPGHDPEAIIKIIDDREVMMVICTSADEDRIGSALEIAESDPEDPAPIALHSRDRRLWRAYFRRLADSDEEREFLKEIEPDIAMEDGGLFDVSDVQLEVMHTPGHSPGSVCLYSEQLGVLFTGDTLHKGKPGEIGGVYPDLRAQLNSITRLLDPLPKDTRVLPGRGEETTVGDEDGIFESWSGVAQEDDDY